MERGYSLLSCDSLAKSTVHRLIPAVYVLHCIFILLLMADSAVELQMMRAIQAQILKVYLRAGLSDYYTSFYDDCQAFILFLKPVKL